MISRSPRSMTMRHNDMPHVCASDRLPARFRLRAAARLLPLPALVLSLAFASPPPGLAADRLEGASVTIASPTPTENGVIVQSGSDGVTDYVRNGADTVLTTRAGTNPASTYLYFKVDDARKQNLQSPVYLVVEYLDSALGTGLRCEYDSDAGDDNMGKYHAAEDQAGGMMFGSKKWKTVVFELQKPKFADRENTGADFRLSGGRLLIRSVRLTHLRPKNWDELNRVEIIDVKPLVKIGAGGQFIVGGFDPAKTGDAQNTARSLEASVPALKSLGVTSHEGYVRWNLCEVAPGKFDWSVYDKFVDVYKRHGLKWVPFLIIGSPYSLPDWYYKTPEAQGYVCLEHGEESDVQSLWNPHLREHVERFIQAFCEHYGSQNVIESILLGITGNYGEAIYPVTGNDWTADIHGPYHTHPGYWCGDKYAVQDFRVWLTRKYGGTDQLRDAWGTAQANIAEAKPFLQKDAPNDRAWLDMVDWYVGSMTRWARFWMQTTRKYYPKGDIYLCTGGHAPPEHGSDFAEQCKLAAEVKGGVRITNEGSDFRGNYSLTHWVASAGRQYGAYFSFEPAGEVNENGVIARIYNASVAGAKGLHYYYPNLFATEKARDNFVKWGGEFRQRQPIKEIAVYYPETYIRLRGNDFLRYLQPLRDRFDFDYKSDGQIADGGLKGVKVLILLNGNIAEAASWQRILDWVRLGGVVYYPAGMGHLTTVEGDETPHQLFFGKNFDHGKGRVVSFPGKGDSAEYRDLLSRRLPEAKELSADTRAMVAADGKEDSVFVSLCKPRELVWMNYTANVVEKAGALKVTLPAYSIVSQSLK